MFIHQGQGIPNSLGSQDLLGKGPSEGSGGERVRLGAGNERPSLDRNLKGLKQIGVDIPWEGVWTQVPSEE